MKTTSLTKRTLAFFVLMTTSVLVQAQQWSGVSTSTGNIYRAGNVGIGVNLTEPTSLLHIRNTNSGDALRIESCWSPGPGAGICNPSINFGGMFRVMAREAMGAPVSFRIGRLIPANAPSSIYIDHNGNVGINTEGVFAYTLSVNGTLRAKEITVETGWSDFVFEKEYKLNSLDSVESYIAEHKHLPEIPSANDVEKNGVQVGEMESKLLMKIEELTLYMIEANKKIKAVETQLESMTETNHTLEIQVASMKEELTTLKKGD